MLSLRLKYRNFTTLFCHSKVLVYARRSRRWGSTREWVPNLAFPVTWHPCKNAYVSVRAKKKKRNGSLNESNALNPTTKSCPLPRKHLPCWGVNPPSVASRKDSLRSARCRGAATMFVRSVVSTTQVNVNSLFSSIVTNGSVALPLTMSSDVVVVIAALHCQVNNMLFVTNVVVV